MTARHLASPHAPRREDEALLRGAGCFGADVPLAGAWHGVFVRSPYAHARLQGLHTAAAAACPGVVAVLSAEELGTHVMPEPNPLLPLAEAQNFALIPHDTVHYAGQPVALVIARTAALATAAAREVVLDAIACPVQTDRASDAPAWVETAHRQGQLPQTAATAQTQLSLARVSASPLEPRHASVHWQGEPAQVTVWLGTQAPSRAQADVAKVLGLPRTAVRLITPDVGGAFGARASISPEELWLALAAQHLAQTHGEVKLRWVSDRSADLLAGMQGRGSDLTGRLWLAENGQLQGLAAEMHFGLGAWLPFSGVVPLRNAARILPGPYALGHYAVSGQGSRSHTAPVNIYRGAGRPEAALLLESLVDKAARARRLDPVAVRAQNLIRPEAMPYTHPHGETLDSGDYPALLQRACEKWHYPQQRQEQARRRAAGECVGIGVAMYVEPCGQGWESARVRWHANGEVDVFSGTPAQGQGHATTFAALAAEALGCAPENVRVHMGDTAHCPEGIGALASRSTAIGGSAIAQACAQLHERLAQGEPLPLEVETRYEAAEAWSAGCVCVRLSIDPETGIARIEELVWVDDAGRQLQPQLVHGQLVGGAAQGIGQALYERLVYDAQGQLLTGSFMDYALPRADQMPPITLESLQTPSPLNRLGAKGVGEAGCIGVPAAILCAAHDALSPWGEFDLSLPLTPEQLWRVISRFHDSAQKA